MNRVSDIAGQPYLLRCNDTGQVLNLRDFAPFETTHRLSYVSTVLDPLPPYDYLMEGWRFTVARWPTNPESLQQQVSLEINDRIRPPSFVSTPPPESRCITQMSLSSLVTLMDGPNAMRVEENADAVPFWLYRDRRAEMFGRFMYYYRDRARTVVTLGEAPVEGAGLRLHLYGLRRPIITR